MTSESKASKSENSSDRVDSSDELRSTDAHLRRIARRLATPDAVEDLVQDVWIRVLRTPPRRGASFIGWLTIVARHQWWRRTRQQAARAQLEREVARPEAIDESELREPFPEGGWVSMAQRLKEPYRSVVLAHFVQGLSIEEIASGLGRPAGTVRSQLCRGVSLLRSHVDQREKRQTRGILVGFQALWSGLESKLLPGLSLLMIPAVLWFGFRGTPPALESVHQLLLQKGGASLARTDLGLWMTPTSGQGRLALPVELGSGTKPVLRGRVLRASGEPVPGATLWVGDQDGVAETAVGSANAEGTFQIDQLPRGQWLHARAAGEPSSARVLLAVLPRSGNLDLICLPRVGTLTGSVVDSRGGPVAGAEVALQPLQGASIRKGLLDPSQELLADPMVSASGSVEWRLAKVTTVTRPDGTFELPHAISGRATFSLTSTAAPSWVEALDLSGDLARTFRLPPPCTVRGWVLDRGGAPVGGVELVIESPDVLEQRRVRSDRAGHFEIGNLAPGSVFVRAVGGLPAGYRGGSAVARATAETREEIELSLDETSGLFGEILVDGVQAQDWQVEISATTYGTLRDIRQTTTDSLGTFEFAGCLAKPYRLRCWNTATPSVQFQYRVVAGEPLRLETCSRAFTLSGHVRLQSGASVPEFVVLFPREEGMGKEVVVPVDPETGSFHAPPMAIGRYSVFVWLAGLPGLWKAADQSFVESQELRIDVPAPGQVHLVGLPSDDLHPEDASASVAVRIPGAYRGQLALTRVAAAFGVTLMPGRYSLYLRRKGRVEERVEVDVFPDHVSVVEPTTQLRSRIGLTLQLPEPLRMKESIGLVAVTGGQREVVHPCFEKRWEGSEVLFAWVDLSAGTTELEAFSNMGMAGEVQLEDGVTPDVTMQLKRRKAD